MFSYKLFGESHGKKIGVVMENVPHGVYVDVEFIKEQMLRRRPNNKGITTSRIEDDTFEILSGVFENRTTGANICGMINNMNVRSSDYDDIKNIPRPSHSDYTAYVRYEGFNDYRGGGHFSGRLTAPIVFAGSIAKLILKEKYGIYIGGHIFKILHITDDPFNMLEIDENILKKIQNSSIPVLNESIQENIIENIMNVKKNLDSLGGIVEIAICNVKCGVGSYGLNNIESILSKHIFSIPAVKGIEFGLGFEFSNKKGSQCNDEMFIDNEDNVKFSYNNNGGILGGISNGQPIIFRVVIKPTSSIARKQNTVNLKTMENVELSIKGRHDPCIVPRAVVALESSAALAMLEILSFK